MPGSWPPPFLLNFSKSISWEMTNKFWKDWRKKSKIVAIGILGWLFKLFSWCMIRIVQNLFLKLEEITVHWMYSLVLSASNVKNSRYLSHQKWHYWYDSDWNMLWCYKRKCWVCLNHYSNWRNYRWNWF